MRVKCVLCDTIGELKDDLPLAKKLRNHPINTYMCESCSDRIKDETNRRVSTGRFIFHRSSHISEKEF